MRRIKLLIVLVVMLATGGRDLARSMDHRRKFACSWNPANRPDGGRLQFARRPNTVRSCVTNQLPVEILSWKTRISTRRFLH